MDEEWVKEVFLKFLCIFSLFAFGSTDMVKQTQSLDASNSISLGKMVWDGFGEL